MKYLLFIIVVFSFQSCISVKCYDSRIAKLEERISELEGKPWGGIGTYDPDLTMEFQSADTTQIKVSEDGENVIIEYVGTDTVEIEDNWDIIWKEMDVTDADEYIQGIQGAKGPKCDPGVRVE